jgi:hypothetical protein
MAPPRKTLAEYEAEAVRSSSGCLVHPSWGAARRVYQMRHGPLHSTVFVCHTCDEPYCIEGSHHFPGTSQDNVRDAVAKGRHSCVTGNNKRGKRGAKHTEEAKLRIGLGSMEVWAGLSEVERAARSAPMIAATNGRTFEQRSIAATKAAATVRAGNRL